jgi:hypothetical protein
MEFSFSFRSDKNIISIKVSEIRKAKDLPATHIGNDHCKNLILSLVHVLYDHMTEVMVLCGSNLQQRESVRIGRYLVTAT